jgi:hypothetical protein
MRSILKRKTIDVYDKLLFSLGHDMFWLSECYESKIIFGDLLYSYDNWYLKGQCQSATFGNIQQSFKLGQFCAQNFDCYLELLITL